MRLFFISFLIFVCLLSVRAYAFFYTVPQNGFSQNNSYSSFSGTPYDAPHTADAGQTTPSETSLQETPPLKHALIMDILYTMGQLHALRMLCYTESDQAWRDRAGRVLEVEAPEPGPHRDRFVEVFNRGYYDAREQHGFCTEDKRQTMRVLARKGQDLASRLIGLKSRTNKPKP